MQDRRLVALFEGTRTVLARQTEYFGTKAERDLGRNRKMTMALPADLKEGLDRALAHELDPRHWLKSPETLDHGAAKHAMMLTLARGASNVTWGAAWKLLVQQCEAHILPEDGHRHALCYQLGGHTMALTMNGDLALSFCLETGRAAEDSSVSSQVEVLDRHDEIVLLDDDHDQDGPPMSRASTPPPRRVPRRNRVAWSGSASPSSSSSSDYDRDDSFLAPSDEEDSSSASHGAEAPDKD